MFLIRMVASPMLGDLQETHQRLEAGEQLLPVDPTWEFPNELSCRSGAKQAHQAVEIGTYVPPSDDTRTLGRCPFN